MSISLCGHYKLLMADWREFVAACVCVPLSSIPHVCLPGYSGVYLTCVPSLKLCVCEGLNFVAHFTASHLQTGSKCVCQKLCPLVCVRLPQKSENKSRAAVEVVAYFAAFTAARF